MKCIPPSGFLLREDGVALARLTEEAGGRPGVSAVRARSIGACSTVRDSRFLRAWRVRIVQWPGGYGPRALVVVSGRLSPESALRQRSWGWTCWRARRLSSLAKRGSGRRMEQSPGPVGQVIVAMWVPKMLGRRSRNVSSGETAGPCWGSRLCRFLHRCSGGHGLCRQRSQPTSGVPILVGG